MVEHELSALAFPTLSAERLEALERCAGATREHFQRGDVLFEVGEREFRFFVVLSGEVEIVDPSGDEPRTVVVHGPGQFTGDVSHITGNPAIVRAVARVESEVLAITDQRLHEVLSQCTGGLADVVLQAFLARRQLLRDSGAYIGLRVVGSRYSQDAFRIRDFLTANRVLHTWMDLEGDPSVASLLERFDVSPEETPIVCCSGGFLLRNPSDRELAEAIGIRRPLRKRVFDLAVIGAGPAGLAAAVYGASEGLRTVVLEGRAPGGQAGRSMRIENYLGFPTGITGGELTDRAVMQAQRFGAQLTVPAPALSLDFDGGAAVIGLEGGESVTARCLLIATGAEYRRLPAEGCERFEGRGVYYAATPMEVVACRGAHAVVVGGGNSAGQAVIYLSGEAAQVTLVIRGADLRAGMSSYLAQRIEHTANVDVLVETTVERMHGDLQLAAVDLRHRRTGAEHTLETPALFSFIGAVPRTDWLPDAIETDSRGFLRTGPDLATSPRWPLRRPPHLLETTQPAVFAAGDVRAGSTKRVASAVGEGAMAVQLVHQVLAER